MEANQLYATFNSELWIRQQDITGYKLTHQPAAITKTHMPTLLIKVIL